MSVDQDLTVVAEAIDDDVVKRWLVTIVFHASVTRQRSTGSLRNDSRAHMYMKSPTLANKGSRKRVPRKMMLKNLVEADDNYKLRKFVNISFPLRKNGG